ncbi:unnamed protein product [Closterium sp. NIES-64]|nr:unnamed protein product [Closterium sp. NIES-64]
MRGSTGGNEGKQGRKGGTERKGGSAEERKGASEEIGRGREQGVSMGERGEKRGSKGKKEGKQGGNGREGGGERRGSMGGKEAKEGGKGGETGAERRGSKGGTEGKQGRKGGGAERERRGSRGKGGEAVEKRRGSRGGKGGELGGEGRGSMGGKGGEARVEMRRRKGGKEGNQGNSRLIPFRASSPSSSSPSAPHPLPPLIPFRASSISVPHPLPRIINFPLSVSSARLCDKERKRANAPAADHVTSGASLLSRAKAPFFSPPFPIPPPVSAPLLHRLALRLPQVAPADSSPIARSEPISPADAVFFPPLPSLSAFHNADLEGGNMRHIGSISNPCLTKRPFLQRAYQEPPPVSGAPIGQHRFVMAGGYRIGANQFAAVGHSLRDLKEEGGSGASKCYWIALDGGYAEGRVRVIYPAEHHWLLYETAIYECTLLVNSTGTTGGSAILMLDEQAVVMHEEGQDEFAIDAPPFGRRDGFKWVQMGLYSPPPPLLLPPSPTDEQAVVMHEEGQDEFAIDAPPVVNLNGFKSVQMGLYLPPSHRRAGSGDARGGAGRVRHRCTSLDEQAVVMHEEGQDEFAIDAPPLVNLNGFKSVQMGLYLPPSHRRAGSGDARGGAGRVRHRCTSLDEQAVVMHEEGQDEFAIDAPPPYHLAFCSYPMYRHLNPKTIQEWLQPCITWAPPFFPTRYLPYAMYPTPPSLYHFPSPDSPALPGRGVFCSQ